MPSRALELISGLAPGSLRCAIRALDVSVSILLNLVLAKPISIFVWWLHAWANRTSFHGRPELARRVKRARKAGRPVLFASNHLSMFDDPVIPMALFRTGPRAAAELSGLVALLLLWRVAPPAIAPQEIVVASLVGYALGIALLGARKTWWSIGDLVNFSGASALRGKLESGRDRPLSLPTRLLLRIADPVVFFFMRSATVKTVLVDRRPGEEGKRSRIRAAERGIELAAEGEQIWIFFEGGRSRIPDEIGPARSGIGRVIEGLQARGIRPVVIAVHQRGLEHVIPISSRRWLTSGHRIDIRWSELEVEGSQASEISGQEPQEIADRVRAAVVRLQSDWRSDHSTDG
jgi:1-acyl-sn-glycerol-3-phosphate acyltransferase